MTNGLQIRWPRRFFERRPAHVLALATLLTSACARELTGEAPPQAFYFPVSVGVPHGSHFGIVVSSNFDLRFTTGWVSAIDTDQVAAALAGGAGGEIAPAGFITSQIQIPSLPGPLAIDATGTIGVIAQRGSRLLTIVDISGGGATLSCADSNPPSTVGLTTDEQRTDCDRRHLFNLASTDNLNSPVWGATLLTDDVRDPYAVTIFQRGGATLVAVGFLSRDADRLGQILIYTLNREGTPMLEPFARVNIGLSATDSAETSALAVRPPDGDGGSPFLAATSHRTISEDRFSTVFGVAIGSELEAQAGEIAATGAAVLGTSVHAVSAETGGFQLPGLVFAPDGNNAYAANNSPDGVVVLDTSLEATQEAVPGQAQPQLTAPRYDVLDFVPTEGQPQGLLYLARPAGDLLAVTSFKNDMLFLLSARAGALLPAARVDNVGAGPFAVADVDRGGGTHWLLVATFFDHGLSVIEVPASGQLPTAPLAQLRDVSLGVANEQR
jgi:hypothetical protein